MSIEDIKNGDINSFESFYLYWHKRVYRYVYKKCSSTYLAEEVVQQVFIRIWNKRDKLRSDLSTEAQLFCITRNLLIDELRKQALLKGIKDQLCHTEEPSYDQHDTIEYKETLNKLYRAIDRMPKMRKLVFIMSRFEYRSYLEISKRLSISPRTVENHISSALKELRKYYFLFLTFLY